MEEIIAQLQSGLKGIWKYRWCAVIVTWLVATAGWARVFMLPDDYQTTARVFVDTQSILKPLLSGMTSVPNVEQQVAIMSRTLLSRPNVERVIRMVDMDISAKTPRDHEKQVDELMQKIRIGGTSTYDIYTISYNNSNPRQVRDVVQSLLTIFVEGSFKGKRGESEKAVQFIDDQIRAYEDKLLAAENSVKEFKLKHNFLLPRQGIDYGAQLLMSSDALNNAKLELVEAEQARNAINAQIQGDVPVLDGEPNPASIDNPEIDGRIAALNKSLDALLLQYTEAHPDIISTRRLIALLEERKVQDAKNHVAPADPGKNYSPMLQQLKVALAEADARVASIKARVAEMQQRHDGLLEQSKAVPEVESQLAQLTRDYQINKENYEKLIGRREAAKLSGDLTTTSDMMSFKIIDPPTMPLRPIGPNRLMLYSIVLGVALVAGAATALLVSQVRPTYLSPAELRDATGLRVLGAVAMTWTEPQRKKRRRAQIGFGAGVACLFASYGGVMALTFIYS
ncbi:polysaccharide chain length determinant protein (PEP-CTERM system associated) [Pseudoduganella flava]|uniref:Chain length-determining protein n=1 Tax=Pseudoduganella flava TaxID=871742 RepID=A0A562PQ96_9BURK|nr:XrtA system polysaccharide chain length determinant [Pseudoduganella flava]QGZ37804.1 chain length-determining protein [Pseudoduganella flava]TWI46625.1 polysaccharide chain length determinant protein (PEP-CTERM system associated) [Pseudoduganella flava]